MDKTQSTLKQKAECPSYDPLDFKANERRIYSTTFSSLAKRRISGRGMEPQNPENVILSTNKVSQIAKYGILVAP